MEYAQDNAEVMGKPELSTAYYVHVTISGLSAIFFCSNFRGTYQCFSFIFYEILNQITYISPFQHRTVYLIRKTDFKVRCAFMLRYIKLQ